MLSKIVKDLTSNFEVESNVESLTIAVHQNAPLIATS